MFGANPYGGAYYGQGYAGAVFAQATLSSTGSGTSTFTRAAKRQLTLSSAGSGASTFTVGVAFPTTATLDDFNTGANTLLTARTGWHATAIAVTGDTSLKVSTPTASVAQKSTAAAGSNFWATSFLNAVASAKFGGQTGTANLTFLSVFTRFDVATKSGYYLEWYLDGTYSAGRLEAAGGSTAYKTHVASGLGAPGFDEIALRSIGTVHQIWYKLAAGAWTLIDSFDDSAAGTKITSPGLIGCRSSATGTVTIDSFGGSGARTVTFASTGSGASSFTRSARRKVAFTSTGGSTTAFSALSGRNATFSSTGSGTSAFARTAKRKAAVVSAGTGTTAFSATPLRAGQQLAIIVPAYIYPDAPATTGRLAWDTWIASPAVKGIIANPGSPGGPGTFTDTNYAAVIAQAQAAGIRIYGYVDTSYTTVALATAEAQVDAWFTLYGIRDIFFDQVSSTTGAPLTYYTTLTNYVRAASASAKTILNGGTTMDVAYASIADILCVFEGVQATYDTYAPSAWNTTVPASKLYHLLYGVSGASAMRADIAKAWSMNAGWVYVTDDASSWFVFPTYFASEDAYIRLLNGLPFPSAGSGTTAFAATKRKAATFASTAVGTSTLTRTVIRAAQLTSNGVGVSVFSAVGVSRGASFASTGSGSSTFAAIARRGSTFSSTGSGASLFARAAKRFATMEEAPAIAPGDTIHPADTIYPGGAVGGVSSSAFHLTTAAGLRITFASFGSGTTTFAPLGRRAAIFASTGTGSSHFSISHPITSSGVGTSVFTRSAKRVLTFSSAGTGISAFARTAKRLASFSSAGTGASAFVPINTFTSNGVGTSTFALSAKRAFALASTGSGVSTLSLKALRYGSFASSGVGSSGFDARVPLHVSLVSDGSGASALLLTALRSGSFSSDGVGFSTWNRLAFASSGVGQSQWILTRQGIVIGIKGYASSVAVPVYSAASVAEPAHSALSEAL